LCFSENAQEKVSGTEEVRDREGGGMREAIVISYDLHHVEFRETRENFRKLSVD